MYTPRIGRLLSLLYYTTTVYAISQVSTITFDATSSSYQLTSAGSAVQIITDQADWPAVLRVADDLAIDFGRVTGTNGSVVLTNSTASYDVPAYNAGTDFNSSPHNASMIFNLTRTTSFVVVETGAKGGVIIAGTVGNSPLIDQLITAGKIDVSAINATWEAFVSAVISDPIPGISTALVIAGKQRRQLQGGKVLIRYR